jgi:hypothetical protein
VIERRTASGGLDFLTNVGGVGRVLIGGATAEFRFNV